MKFVNIFRFHFIISKVRFYYCSCFKSIIYFYHVRWINLSRWIKYNIFLISLWVNYHHTFTKGLSRPEKLWALVITAKKMCVSPVSSRAEPSPSRCWEYLDKYFWQHIQFYVAFSLQCYNYSHSLASRCLTNKQV